VSGTYPGEYRLVRGAPLEPAGSAEPSAAVEPAGSRDGSRRIAFAVDLDFGRVDEMTSVIRNTLHWHAPHALQIDLSRVGYLDCAGISGLLACHAEAAAIGCRLSVCHPRPIVARLLCLTGTFDALRGGGAGEASEAGL
jgi:anti-anti-sigma factor